MSFGSSGVPAGVEEKREQGRITWTVRRGVANWAVFAVLAFVAVMGAALKPDAHGDIRRASLRVPLIVGGVALACVVVAVAVARRRTHVVLERGTLTAWESPSWLSLMGRRHVKQVRDVGWSADGPDMPEREGPWFPHVTLEAHGLQWPYTIQLLETSDDEAVAYVASAIRRRLGVG